MQEKLGKAAAASRRMVRKQLLLTPEQARQLRARASAIGLSEAELVRAMLDRELGLGQPERGWKERLLRLAGSLGKGDADDLEAKIRENLASWDHRLEDAARKLRGE